MDKSALKKQHAKKTSVLHFSQGVPLLHVGLGALVLLYQCTSKCQQPQNTLVLHFGPNAQVLHIGLGELVFHDSCGLEGQ